MTADRCTHSFPDPFPQPISQIGDCRNCDISYQEAKAAMTTPSDELRAASARLRELIKAISPPVPANLPFHADDTFVTQGEEGIYQVAQTETPELAAYIAAMGPPVAEKLADWLDTAAANAAALTWPNDFIERALDLGRQINTGSQP